MLSAILHSRLLIAAALIALILCLLPVRVDAPQALPDAASPQATPAAQALEDGGGALTAQTVPHSPSLTSAPPAQAPDATQAPRDALTAQSTAAPGVPAGADLSGRTAAGCRLHRTLYYAPCGHSVQRREALPAKLVGLSRQALEAEIESALPGAIITGFSAGEVDASFSLSIPCPLHWVLDRGEGSVLVVRQNRDGEALALVRETDVFLDRLTQEQLAELPRIFDDAQALEGVLESLGS